MLLSIMLLLGLAKGTEAGCSKESGAFSLDRDGSYAFRVEITGGDWCSFSFALDGDAVANSLRLVTPPRHGKLGPEGGASQTIFRYTPNRNYRGADSFTIRICGEELGRKGCARLTYTISVI